MTEELRAAQGTLLAATPEMLDPNFMHGVVLVCQHTEDGAYGLVINRKSEYTTRKLLAEHPLLGQVDHPIYLGGPVQLNAMQILHRVPEHITGGAEILPGLWIGGDFDEVARFVSAATDAPDRVRLIIGYSGWSGGQLDRELAHGAWLPAPGSVEHVFEADADKLWRDVVRSLGPETQGMDLEPPHPSWN